MTNKVSHLPPLNQDTAGAIGPPTRTKDTTISHHPKIEQHFRIAPERGRHKVRILQNDRLDWSDPMEFIGGAVLKYHTRSESASSQSRFTKLISLSICTPQSQDQMTNKVSHLPPLNQDKAGAIGPPTRTKDNTNSHRRKCTYSPPCIYVRC